MAVWGNATFEIKDVVDKNPNLYLKRAEIALKDGRYKDALEEIICAETFANGNIDIVSQCIEVKKALRRMGFSSEKDTFKIIQMYANAGDAEALHLMGCIYLRGYYGVEPSYTTALKYFLSANQIDSSKANFEIGYFFCYGLGIKPDYRKAKKYLLEVIKKNDSETSSALCLIGEMYEQGRGVEKDIESAKKFYLKALEYDEHKGLAYLGLSKYFFNIGDMKSYFKCCKKASDNGSIGGKKQLSVAYLEGWGCIQNIKKGISMLKEVYEEVEVNEILAEFYTEHGDSDKAFQYARSSWDAGRIKCAYILGSLYLGENSKYRNIQEGMRILKYASQKGDVDAMLLYGIELIKREKYADSLTVLKQAYNNGQEMAKPYIDALEEGFRTNEI